MLGEEEELEKMLMRMKLNEEKVQKIMN